MSNNEFAQLEQPKGLARGLIAASREPLLVLDQDLLVVAASHSFLSKFLVTSQNTGNREQEYV